MVLRSDDTELKRTLNEMIGIQADLGTRVERLETLEFEKRSDGVGCVSFEDSDTQSAGASSTLDVSPQKDEAGDFKNAHAVLTWSGITSTNVGNINLFMRINGITTANYYYAYKYSNGATLTQSGAESQSQIFIGRINRVGLASGRVFIPFYSKLGSKSIFGDWTLFDSSGAANRKVEKGEFGGTYYPAASLRVNQFTIFPAADTLHSWFVHLHLWCPPLDSAGLPGD